MSGQIPSFSKDQFLIKAREHPAWMHDGEFEPGAAHFLAAFYEDSLQNEGLDFDLKSLLALAAHFWRAGSERTPGTAFTHMAGLADIAQFSPEYDLIEIITDDSRFLVDSVIGELSSHNVEVAGLFHPVVDGFRTIDGKWLTDGAAVSESMILLIVPRQSATRRKQILHGINQTLADVAIAIKDFRKMQAHIDEIASELKARGGTATGDDVKEAIHFLKWIKDGNFVLLGCRTYIYKQSNAPADYVTPKIDEEHSLGILSNPNILVLRQSSEPSVIAANTQMFLETGTPLIVAKSNLTSRVHRRVRMDYISVKKYSADGTVIGETRFIGLFTNDAYARSPKYVPLLRRKIARVIERYNAPDGSHNAKRLDFVLATYPRDELFQINDDDLYRIATSVAHAYDRPRARLFVREDPFRRFISALVYVPRENYNTDVRQKIGAALKDAWNGRISAFYPQYSDSPLARVHFIIGLDPKSKTHPDLKTLETKVAQLAQPWGSDLADTHPPYKNAFPPAYRARFDDAQAAADIDAIGTLRAGEIRVKSYRLIGDPNNVFRARLFRREDRIEPSDIMPILSDMGLHIAEETGYKITPTGTERIWIHDFEIRSESEIESHETLASIFEGAIEAILKGENEQDRFNSLILPQAMPWRYIALLRLLARYRRQSGMDPSEELQIAALQRYPEITRLIIELFQAKFDPAIKGDMQARRDQCSALSTQFFEALEAVSSLDHDRALRRITQTLLAALRTNFYQSPDKPAPFISLKIDSQALENLPAPRPYREIFVCSPRVEGVHLRFGPVARGGLRWSDRRDDFRTEVLGLVKAQQVKNAVIVPVGSKGGFYPKQLPTSGERSEIREAGIAAYQQFIAALLSITDSYEGDGIRRPQSTICWDDPDPYLVVAADKGTASFSDIANEMAAKFDFWLDDAFASGGSVGYDHKAMGITARGAWEAVKRHFREIGRDVQSSPFTAIGVGDMSGDVFGNGMLLSRQTRLLAAFDHRDIFVDPDPDAKRSFAERARLYGLARSSWADYDASRISAGGGVFSRSAKSITLTSEIKSMTGLTADTVTPNQLIKALLAAQTDLLWFGGIGTYIKSTNETHSDVRDKGNDAIRINGADVGAKIIGEGANLGLTQAGRIEFAKQGGRINTDAIDNAAGVDCSDNEINIKILLRAAIQNGALNASSRTQLLSDMTEDVARLVLAHNYDQTLALSVAHKRARKDHGLYEMYMRRLEKEGRLDRAVEGLPSTTDMTARETETPLTRPELAVINAYAKNTVYDALSKTELGGDPYFEETLRDYFPPALHEYKKALASHRLRREIICSRLANDMIDIGGPLFPLRTFQHTAAGAAQIAAAFTVARDLLGINALRADIAALDNVISADAQYDLHEEIRHVLQRVTGWLIKNRECGDISAAISSRKDGMDAISGRWIKLLSPYDQRRVNSRIQRFIKSGIPKAIAEKIALLRTRASGFDVIALSNETDWPLERAAELFYDIGGRFKIDRMRALSVNNRVGTLRDNQAQKRTEEEFFTAQSQLTRAAAAFATANGKNDASIRSIIAAFSQEHEEIVKSYDAAYQRLNEDGKWTLAHFSLAAANLREITYDVC